MTAKLHVLAALAAAVAAAPASAAAQRIEAPAPQRIEAWFFTVGKTDKPVHVVAKGPISGIGTATQTEKRVGKRQVNYATLHFDRGTVTFTAPERFDWKPDRAQCLAHANGGGTFTITGGTGAFTGASGKGTFTAVGTAFAQRSRTGACRGLHTPIEQMIFVVKVTLTGTAAVG
jgi:hypothetical protein